MEIVSKGQKNNILIKKIVVWITLLFMPLSTYATFIEGITIGDFSLIIGTIIIILYMLKSQISLNKTITWTLIFYIMFIVLHSLIFWIIKPNDLESSSVLGVARYILYIFWVSISAKEFFDFSYAYKIYKVLAIIFGGYCILQFIAFHLFKIFLPINVLGLKPAEIVTMALSENRIGAVLNGTLMYRPYSVFLEPSYFSAFQIPILYIILNGDMKNEKKRYLTATFITISLLTSISTTGMVMLIVCWFSTMVKVIRKNYNTIIIVIFVILLIITICIFNGELVRKMLSRVINEDGTAGSSVIGRFSSLHTLYDGTYNFKEITFGQGMWTETNYLPSYGRIVISFGIVGLIYIMAMFLQTYLKANKIGKSMVIILLILCIGTNTLFNISSVLIFSLIYSNMKKEQKVNDL